MKLASALPQNSVVFSGGILPPSKSGTAIAAGATFGAGAGWNEATVAGSMRSGLAAGEPVEELLDTIAAAAFEEEVLLVPHATKTIQHPTHPAAAKIPTRLLQRLIAAMLPDFN